MAQVDVTELLSDPDFVDPIQLISRVPRVNSFGEQSFVESTLNAFGSVQSASPETIARVPEAFRVANLKSFWFKGEIIATAPGRYSSVLIFKGVRYQVVSVFDWKNWGAGWTEGACVAERPA